MKSLRFLAILAASIGLFVSCNDNTDYSANNPYTPLKLSAKSSGFIQKGNSFNFKFLSKIDAAEKQDYIISPLSMQFLLGMILNGAQGETANEICNVLGYGDGETEAVNEYALSLLEQLPAMDKKTTLSIANAIFVDKVCTLYDSYEQTVKKHYQATVDSLDFADTQNSLKVINGWCSDHTNGMIPKALDKVDPDMLAYLMNAIYFKSKWQDQFQKRFTEGETFTDEAGSKKFVPMMKQTHEYSYTENTVFQAVRLPYGNGAFSMTVLLPTKGNTVADIIATLCKSDWQNLQYGMETYSVNLWLPRFETKYHIKLNDILSGMGMPLAFDEVLADFKAMSNYASHLDFVQQDAAIKVDEEGTEAAAVSIGGMMKETAFMPERIAVFHADHPFLYIIHEKSSQAILFAGRYSGK